MLGTARTGLEEELRQLKMESQKLHEQFLQTKRLLINAEPVIDFIWATLELTDKPNDMQS